MNLNQFFLKGLLAVLLVTVFSSSSFSQSMNVFGEDGETGTSGENGNPGTAGGQGGDGGDVVIDEDLLISNDSVTFGSFGGAGGFGGDGGNGSSNMADGGDAGAGGNGGNANSHVINSAPGSQFSIFGNAYGGSGGSGGQPGTGLNSGSGGNGGHGGNADSYGEIVGGGNALSSRFYAVRVDSFGGSGGVSYGPNAQAGNGGNATARGLVESTNGVNSTSLVDLEIVGGRGGFGFDGAHAGDGGTVSVGVAQATSFGGSNNEASVRASLRGGDGGSAGLTGNAGDGASVVLDNAVEAVSDGLASMIQNAYAGDAGDVERGQSGVAGSATSLLSILQDPAEVSLSSGFALTVEAEAGNGGDRTDSVGAASDGANGLAESSATTRRRIALLSARSEAGNGGWGREGAASGEGGDAVARSVLNQTYDASNGSGGEASTFASALGGDAGGRVDGDGTGQTGGSAFALSTTQAQGVESGSSRAAALAGRGGSIGVGGNGNGGSGGEAFAESTTTSSGEVESIVSVRGGNGGTGSGVGFRGGDGSIGTAVVFAESTTNDSVLVSSRHTGGSGGSGINGADAGDGADISLENVSIGVTTGFLELSQEAIAGSAGAANGGGMAGRAGNASTVSSGDYAVTRLTIDDRAQGGWGGNGSGENNSTPSGGGDGSVDLNVSSMGDTIVSLVAIGGDGGSSNVSDPGSSGGNAILNQAIARAQNDVNMSIQLVGGSAGGDGAENIGGTAIINGPVLGESTQGGNVTVILSASGGDADFVEDSSAASVSLVNEISAVTSGAQALQQVARAGDAFAGPQDPDTYTAPSAHSELSHVSDSESLNVDTGAYGGAGARAFNSPAYAGGDAVGIASATNRSGSAIARTEAFAGQGGSDFQNDPQMGGAGGHATSTAIANTFGATSNALAVGRATGGRSGSSDLGGVGGNATSSSLATASGTGTATANDRAFGGWSSANSISNRAGNGVSSASATSRGEATAMSVGVGGVAGLDSQAGIEAFHGDGFASAQATSLLSHASSTSFAGSGADGVSFFTPVIQMGRTRAESIALGVTSESIATARAGNASAVQSLEASASSRSNGATFSVAATGAGVISAVDRQAVTNGSSAVVVALPDDQSVNELLAGSAIAEDFDTGGQAEMITYMNMGAGFSADDSSGDLPFSSSVEFEINSNYLETEQNLLLGILGSTLGDAGFDQLHFRVQVENQLLVEQTFTDSDEAMAYFSEQTIDLGMWSDLFEFQDVLDFSIELDVFGSLADMGFQFDAVLGNATVAPVPLPAAFWLMLSGLGLLYSGKGRRR
ncbi:MAG: beta strand repeat-containing protein [Gammaproteobacteria bacterium]